MDTSQAEKDGWKELRKGRRSSGPETDKQREARLRRECRKQGYKLTKGLPNYADSERGYMICDGSTGLILMGTESGLTYEATLDDVEEWLKARSSEE